MMKKNLFSALYESIKEHLLKFFVDEEKEYFIENLHMLLASGMTILLALEAIQSEMRSKYFRRIIGQAQDDIESGAAVWKALHNTRLFSDHIISLIRLGEESGRLAENLQVISKQERKESDFKSKFSSALMYPLFIFAVTITVGLGIAWFILPNISTVFLQLKVELPLVTRLLILLGEILKNYGLVIIPGALLLFFVIIYTIFFNPRFKFIGQRILFAIPPIKKIIIQLELTRMGYILGSLLDAGLPFISALESLERSSSFYYYRDLYSFIRAKVVEGHSLNISLKLYKNSSQYIPRPVQQMIMSGEQSGQLPVVLKTIGEIYELKVDTSMKNLPVILEHVLLVMVWLGVIIVAVAVILPLYSLIGSFNE